MRHLKSTCCLVACMCVFSSAGCIPGLFPDQLSATQEQALAAAVQTIAGIADVSQAARSASRADEEGDISVLKGSGSKSLTFGECPEIAITGSGSSANLSLAIAFGTGCQPEWAASLTCSGSMDGTIDFGTRSMSFGFTEYTCGQTELDGSMAYHWGRDQGTVTLDIDADLTIRLTGTDVVDHSGSGAIIYTASDATTNFSTYDGALTVGAASWTLVLSETLVSYPAYGNYVPYGGTALLTEVATSETFAVTFDSNSPVTGEVQVSINGRRPFTYTIAGF